MISRLGSARIDLIKDGIQRIKNNPRGIINYFHHGMFGDSVTIEASGVCQLHCPLCPTGQGVNAKGAIGHGYLRISDFKKFIDAHPRIKEIALSNFGEMFLNPHLEEIVEYAYRKGVILSALNGVNLNNASERMLEALVKYKFGSMSVSIDGASDEVYAIYRKGGNFTRVIENIKKINHYKRKYKSEFPKLNWQFIIFGHNEHELPEARKKSGELNMVFKPKLNVFSSFSPIKNMEFVKKESGFSVASREEFKEKYKRDYTLPCWTLFFHPFINWNGSLLGCCYNRYNRFDNVFQKGLKKALQGKLYMDMKKIILWGKPMKEGIPCANCNIYKTAFTNTEPKKIETNLF